VQIASSRFGELALGGLLEVADNLHEDHPSSNGASLRFSTEQLVRIAKRGERPALENLHFYRVELSGHPYYLTSDEAVAILAHGGGGQALKAFYDLLPKLIAAPHNLSREQVLELASQKGGRLELERALRKRPINPS
jgi:hypothetical protein